ncbi:MAG: PEP-CTERM sorting domain-containing protein [Burkholderiaceae bacterium]|nr:PEP-CTERM sorting domain-containing protein [Rhodoferax sp.]MCP5283348.1 PEP-CTERM sorting domain-containing protein [Burkholderiaceae bacterium]
MLKPLSSVRWLVPALLVAGASVSHAGLVVLPVATDTSTPIVSGEYVVNQAGDPAKARGDFKTLLKEGDTRKEETFSGFVASSNPMSSLTLSSIGAEVTVGTGSGLETGRIVSRTYDPIENGRFDTTGDNNAQWWLTDNSFELNFSGSAKKGISALAFYGTDIGDFDGSFSLRLLKAGEAVDANGEGGTLIELIPFRQQATSNNGANNGWLSHFGFYDDENVYERVIFELGQANGDDGRDFIGFDDFLVGELNDPTTNPVPEPGSLALVCASLLALTAARRRRTGSNKA